jgi:CheY-like chemotaxis protein/REP element-mobilizing transposase RayT
MSATILFVHRQLAFAVSIKQALERVGGYEVHPFTAVDAAIEYLAGHPQDLAVVDFEMPSANGDEIVVLLRETQAGIPVIATPVVGEPVVQALQLQGNIGARFTARDLIPLLQAALEKPSEQRSGLLNRVAPDPASDELSSRRTMESHSVSTTPRIRTPEDKDAETIADFFQSPPKAQQTQFIDPSHAIPTTPRLLTPEERDAATIADFFQFSDEPETPDPAHRVSTKPGMQTPEEKDAETIAEFFRARLENAPPTVPIDTSELFEDVTNWQTEAETEYDADYSVGGTEFDGVLGSIDTDEEVVESQRPADEFDDLVNSMRTDEPHRPLPDRQETFFEFIITGGMDNLVSEIEKKRTDKLVSPDTPPDTLPEEPESLPPPEPEPPQLAPEPEEIEFEEPFMPTFEDSGTVGDLITGVADTGFLNVLSILRGEEPRPESKREPSYPTADPDFSMTDAVDNILSAIEADRSASEPILAAPTYQFDFDDDDEDSGSTPAKLILETALDDKTPSDSFSISELIGSIERQLPSHRPKVQPLPSWIREDERRNPTSLRDKVTDQIAAKDRARKPPTKPLPPDELPEVLPEIPAAATVMHATDDYDITILHESDTGIVPDELPEEFAATGAIAYDDFFNETFDQTTIPNRASAPAADLDSRDTEWLPQEQLGIPDEHPDDTTIFGDTPIYGMPPVDADELAAAATVIETEPPKADEDTEGYTQPLPAPQADVLAYEERAATLQDSNFERMAAFEPYEREAEDIPALEQRHIDDPYIAQLALSLTDVSLELTAEATLLTRDGEIVAYAGRMAQEELLELRDIIGAQWDAPLDQARVRFINLPSSGRDYLVYSRGTVDNLTLTLFFAAETPLRNIRQQGKRLIDAMSAVPEIPTAITDADDEQAASESGLVSVSNNVEVVDATVRTPYAYVWLLRDPNKPFARPLAQAIISGMNVQLKEKSWKIREIRAVNEYVYLLADVPGEIPPYQVVRDLKRRAAQIAGAQNRQLDPDSLWADSYLVVTPGRALDDEEIQQFINFERMF